MSGVYHVYKVLRWPTLEELEKNVNFLLNSGWVLAGGVVISEAGNYMQAMTFSEEKKPE